LQSAIHVIENNVNRISYPLVSGIANKGNVYHYSAANEKEEADFIVKTIKALVGSFELTGEESNDDVVMSFSDIAILTRTRWIVKEIEKALNAAGIPYHQGEKHEWESDAAKRLYQDVITLSASEWHQKILPDKSFSEKQLLENIIPIIEHYENPDNFSVMEDWEKEILIYSAAQSDTLSAFIAEIETALKEYSGYAHAEKISLLTLHAAKGLEFPVVFIPGCDDGILPYRLKGDENCHIDEERRLFYVGLTRSSSQIYLSGAGKRYVYSKEVIFNRSPFLDEMRIKIQDIRLSKKPFKAKKVQMELFG
jgi:superfamily I DNA/RNA helicase